MKLACFSRNREGEPAIGAVVGDGIVDIRKAAPTLPHEMIGIIAGGETVLAKVRDAVLRGIPEPLTSVHLLAPVPHPPEFLAVGLNYRSHAAEVGNTTLPTEPKFFNKQTSCIVGPYDDVVLPRVSDDLDYEGELGFVVGRAGRNLSREQAAGAIFGYVVVNDLSVRDWQLRSPTTTIGKSFDTHGPFGPWIVTADDIPNPKDLVLTTMVNGDVRQHTATDLMFDCIEIVAFLSRVMTLQPGTVITTGTPAGVGGLRKPPAYLRVGDLVSVEISGIGRIENRVIAEV